MILEQNIPPFFQWIGLVTVQWFIAVGTLLAVAALVGVVLSIVRHGFGGFLTPFIHAVNRGVENITSLSWFRIWAVARLTIQESLRRRVLVVFAMFMLLLLLGGWFLDTGSENPAKLYMTFVLSATSILILLLSLFLSSFSLPTDFKNKTIYSVVTKPVRSSELVFGRMLGIALIGTVILGLMGVCSYLFVTSGLQHTHLLTESDDLTPLSVTAKEETGADSKPETNARTVTFRGETRLTAGHKHPVTVFSDGMVVVEPVNGHTHAVTTKKVEEQTRYTVEASRGTLQARVPVYGHLAFRDANGMDKDKGINVGDEWEYRSYIGGSTRLSDSVYDEAAIYEFTGIREDMFPRTVFTEGLPVEMTLGVFRTHKGDIEQGVTASYSLRNPVTGLRVEVATFSTEEFITKAIAVPWTFDGTPQITQRRSRSKKY